MSPQLLFQLHLQKSRILPKLVHPLPLNQLWIPLLLPLNHLQPLLTTHHVPSLCLPQEKILYQILVIFQFHSLQHYKNISLRSPDVHPGLIKSQTRLALENLALEQVIMLQKLSPRRTDTSDFFYNEALTFPTPSLHSSHAILPPVCRQESISTVNKI